MSEPQSRQYAKIRKEARREGPVKVEQQMAALNAFSGGKGSAHKDLEYAKRLNHQAGHSGHRNVSSHDRRIDRRNALKGTAKWSHMPSETRSGKRMRPSHGWGFEGESPATRTRKYHKKRNRGEPPLPT